MGCRGAGSGFSAVGEAGEIGSLSIVTFAVPGHTPGSGAYLINGVLYVGDAVAFSSGGATMSAPWIFDNNTNESAASVKALAKRLGAARVDMVATGHTAPGPISALQ